MEKQNQQLVPESKMITVQCAVCSSTHFDTPVRYAGKKVTDPGIYDGYVVDAYELGCGHFACYSRQTPGGYKLTGQLVGFLETLERSQSSVELVPLVEIDPTHFYGEKI